MADRITAMDVEKQEFTRKVRGYDPDEVRIFLSAVAEEVGRLNLENADLRDQMGRLQQASQGFERRERDLHATLLSAQSLSGEMKERARAEADLIVRRGRMDAERALQQAQDQLARLEAEISRCRLERDLFERRLRSTLEEHLLLLDQRRHDLDEMPDNLRLLPRSATEAG